ncbi:unnamed protein product [Caenorhabditis nigoni]
MKVLLVAGILLSCAQTSIGLNISQKIGLVGIFNALRYNVAKEEEIGNMNELMWYNELQHVVEDMPCDKLPLEVTIALLDPNTTDAEGTRLLEEKGGVMLTCAMPTQTQIACAVRNCNNTIYPYCVCGPHEKYSKTDIIFGDPGTKCPGEVIYGLCARVLNQRTPSKTRATEKHEYDYEEDGSSNFFTIGAILNLIAFSLVTSFL